MKEFPDMKPDEILEEPLLYTSYVLACEGHEANYVPIKDMEHLKGILEAKLEEYNENVGSMNLVLFDQAMEHISRIARIVNLPVGSALCMCRWFWKVVALQALILHPWIRCGQNCRNFKLQGCRS